MTVLHLFHGRKTPFEVMADWGEDGPTFPVKWVHTTYASHVRLCKPGEKDGHDIELFDDLLYYDGMFYGDWSVYDYEACDGSAALTEFDPAKARWGGPAPCAIISA